MKKIISILTFFLIASASVVLANDISEREEKVFELFQHQQVEQVNYELSEEGIYNFQNTAYQASFSEQGIKFKKEDSALSVGMEFNSFPLIKNIIEKNNRIVYRFSDFVMLYTPVDSGLKSDIILFEKPERDLSFSWQLDLTDGQMTAKLEANGSIGIYNGTQNFFNEKQSFGDISQKVREGIQNQLVYTIPAPVIIEANGISHNDLSYYELENNILKLKIKGDLSELIYPISIDPSISFGSEYVFRSSSYSLEVDATTLNSTHAFIVYGEGNPRKAVIATVNGSIISYGPAYTFNSTAGQEIVITTVDSTHVLIVYHDPNGAFGTAILATVNLSDSSISFGLPYVFNNLSNFRFTVTTLDSTRVLISSSRNNQVAALVATVNLSDSSISFGSEYVFNPASEAQYLSAVTLDPNKVLIAYKDDGSTGDGTAIIANISGSVISFGSKYVFNTGSAFYISASALDPSHAFISYNIGGIGKSRVAIVNGSVISFGPEYSSGPSPTGISVTTLNQETVFISFIDFASANKGTAVIATIDTFDNSIYFDPENIFNQGATIWNTHATTLDYNRVLVAYEDDGNGGFGTAIVTPVGGVDPPIPVIYPPSVTTNIALPVASTSSQINGSLTNLGGDVSTRVWFEWGLTASYGSSTTPVSMSGIGTFFSQLNGLTPSTTYNFRAVGDNTAGSSYGAPRTFTTLAAPNSPPNASSVFHSPDPVNVGNPVTFTGNWTEPNAGDNVKMYICKDSTCLNCNNSSQTNCWCYSSVWNIDTSDTCTYTTTTAGTNNYWMGACDDDNACDVTPLLPIDGTFAVNNPINPPSVTTNSANGTTSTSVQLNGSITNLGGAPSANVWFQWGLTTSYGNNTTPVSKSTPIPDTFFSQLNGLTPNTTYNFRAAGSNTASTTYGINRTFTTLLANGAPDAASVTSTPNPVNVGNPVTFTGNWTEPNAGDNVKMYICKDSTCLSCNNSAQTNCWCYSSVWNIDTSDTCTYTTTTAGTNNYWMGACDDDNACDTTPLAGGTFTVNSVAPTANTFSSTGDTKQMYCHKYLSLSGVLTDGGKGLVDFSWKYSSPIGLNMQKFYFQASTFSDFSILTVGKEIAQTISNGETITYSVEVSTSSAANELLYNKSYYWRVMVCDTNSICSTWVNSPSQATTSLHHAPVPEFTWNILEPAADKIAQFCTVQDASCSTNVSTCYDNNNNNISCSAATFNWIIPSSAEFVSTTASSANPRIKFNDSGTNEVTLEITGSGPCAECHSLEVTSLPKWIEVSPLQ